MFKPLLFLVIILFTSGVVSAADAKKVVDSGVSQPYVGARALGMGNAFTAVADDHNAIFYNPAGLARKTKSDLRLFFTGSVDPDLLDFVDEADKTISASVTDSEKITNMSNLLQSNFGEFFHARVLGPSVFWTKKNWGVAFIPVNMEFNTKFQNFVAGPGAGIDTNIDSTLALSYAKDVDWLGDNHWLSWGVTGKLVNRIGVNKAFSAADAVVSDEFFDIDKDGREGMTLDFDVGFLWTPKISQSSFLQYAEPTFSVSVKNILDYGYPIKLGLVSENKDDDPVKLGRRLDFGSAWRLPGFWVFDTVAAVDIRDIGQDNWTFNKSYHAGVEFHWTMKQWWQGHWSVGVNQGYLSAGFGGRIGWFQMDLAFWGEEVGTKSARKEDRRFLAELSMNF